MIVKTCTKCGREQDLSCYDTHKLGKHQKNPVCKSCRNIQQQINRQTNGYKAQIKYKYGISIEEYQYKIKKQNNCCVICKKEFDPTIPMSSPCIDHNHTTKQVRDILCRNCNLIIGHAKENIDILQTTIEYLKKWQ